MAKYRKKPIVVEVTGQFFRASKFWPKGTKKKLRQKRQDVFYVVTIHGQETTIVDGDWIIQEPDGKHYYPCKPDIFKATYELVDA